MANEKMQPWHKFIIWGITVTFCCGMTYNAINHNTERIITNADTIKEHSTLDDARHREMVERLHQTELQYIKQETMLKAIDERTKRIHDYIMDWEPDNGVQK